MYWSICIDDPATSCSVLPMIFAAICLPSAIAWRTTAGSFKILIPSAGPVSNENLGPYGAVMWSKNVTYQHPSSYCWWKKSQTTTWDVWKPKKIIGIIGRIIILGGFLDFSHQHVVTSVKSSKSLVLARDSFLRWKRWRCGSTDGLQQIGQPQLIQKWGNRKHEGANKSEHTNRKVKNKNNIITYKYNINIIIMMIMIII